MVGLDLIRAPLFVPASRPERFAKAAASGADAVILDLEDAVAPADKDAARAGLGRAIADLPVADLPLIVRINAAGTPWHAQDLASVRDLPLAGVMLPKAETPEVLAQVADALPVLPLVALIETACGLARARAIAALPCVARLAFGSVDFCADLGCAHTPEALLAARSELVLAARLARRAAPLDGVTTDVSSSEAARRDALHAKMLGMTGKLCIHPRQVEPVRQAFAPDQAMLDWARKVLAAGDGAVALEGEMIDEPVRRRARAILAAAGRE
ncbi:HpcH/HpaI aldolase/citrate lyase family protein [Frigidibacter oleivorans]|uniref:HpcH/HpaI aldolase/citrate lyase family protein n=1 Tax=Frigidibacter oleivorans TaxID=2487129 RepID=UPI000F8EC661|nr:CoA ester lyase [Frigidibacter oleivorans]